MGIVGIGAHVPTTPSGDFMIQLPNGINVGETITLEVNYKDYVIKSPVNGLVPGQIVVPRNPLSNPIRIVIVPKIENKANKYFQLGNEYFLLDFELAECYYKTAITIQPSHINAIIRLGDLFKFYKEYNEALKWYNEALPLSIKIHGKSSQKVLECFENIALVYFAIANYENAIYNFQEALQIIEQNYNSDLSKKASIMKNIGSSYLFLGEYSKAFKYSEEAKKIQSNLKREDQQ